MTIAPTTTLIRMDQWDNSGDAYVEPEPPADSGNGDSGSGGNEGTVPGSGGSENEDTGSDNSGGADSEVLMSEETPAPRR